MTVTVCRICMYGKFIILMYSVIRSCIYSLSSYSSYFNISTYSVSSCLYGVVYSLYHISRISYYLNTCMNISKRCLWRITLLSCNYGIGLAYIEIVKYYCCRVVTLWCYPSVVRSRILYYITVRIYKCVVCIRIRRVDYYLSLSFVVRIRSDTLVGIYCRDSNRLWCWQVTSCYSTLWLSYSCYCIRTTFYNIVSSARYKILELKFISCRRSRKYGYYYSVRICYYIFVARLSSMHMDLTASVKSDMTCSSECSRIKSPSCIYLAEVSLVSTCYYSVGSIYYASCRWSPAL